jgi:HK97 family phage portal protein
MGQEKVLGLAAVYACVRFISDAMASLPVKVYRELPGGAPERIYSTQLLGSPIAGGGPQLHGTFYNWIYTGTASALLHGNAWGFITNRSGIPGPDGLGLPTKVAWLPNDRISVRDSEMQPENPRAAQLWYMGHVVPLENLIHLPAFTIPGRLEAISPMLAFASLWAQGLEALDYSETWFHNGGFPPGSFQNMEETVSEDQSREIRRILTDTIRMRQPLVYGKDWDYKPIAVPPNEAAFIQAMQLNATQVAAVYGVRPQRAGGTRNDGLTYSNQLMDMVDEVQSTLRPWITRWEHLITSMLPATQFVKFDIDDLLRGDPKSRADIYLVHRNMGSMSANEVRAYDDRPPVPGGDDHIPLPVLERMIATTRSFPKAFVPLVEPEADKIAALMLGLQEEHPELFNPVTTGQPPMNEGAPQFLGKLLTQVRAQLFGGDRQAPAQDSDRKSAVSMLSAHEALGHLPAEEAASRKVKAMSAKTTGELADLFNNLPNLYDKDVEHAGVAVAQRPGRERADNTQRAQARNLLAQHHRKGRLRDDELDERCRRASEAVTCGDLATLFADLPPEDLDRPALVETRTGEVEPLLFGPAALALLHGRADHVELAARAALNGKGH